MANIVLGLGTSHAPPLFLEPEHWAHHSRMVDTQNKELISPRTGKPTPYEDLRKEVAVADPDLPSRLTLAVFEQQYAQLQRGVASVAAALRRVNPDVLIIVSDDQDELLFDDNMPAFSIYWGETFKLLPRTAPPGREGPVFSAMARGWGDVELDVPVDAQLGEYLIGYLNAHDFDVAHMRYLRDSYGGSIGPSDYIWWKRETPNAQRAMPHGFAFVVKSIMDNQPLPILPVFQNTCYPPNRPTPRRCYAFGRALRQAIEAWPGEQRVAVIASGGLSHFVLDEQLDRQMLQGLQHKDSELLANLPRLDSPTGEIRNWVTVGGACEHLDFHLFEYLPVPRSDAGTGGGWAFAEWT